MMYFHTGTWLSNYWLFNRLERVLHEPDDSVTMFPCVCVCAGHGVFHSSDPGESAVSWRLQEDPWP